MNSLDELKSKITDENKTIIGVVGLILAFLFWGIGHPNIGLGDVLLLIFPAILLIIPTIKNSKALGIISAIILVILLIVGLSAFSVVIFEYLPDSYMFPDGYVAGMFIANVLQIILCLYGLFCAYLLTVPTIPNGSSNVISNNIVKSGSNRIMQYDKYCIECGHGLMEGSKFCPKCGTDLTIQDNAQEEVLPLDEDTNEKNCSECGQELSVEDRFCPNCGKKLTDSIDEENNGGEI